MEAPEPITRMTRFTILGQVALLAWLLPGGLVAAWLQKSLGHVSGAVITPFACQILLGMFLHSALVLIGSQKLVGSYFISLSVALAANVGVLCVIVVTEGVSLPELPSVV